MAVLKVKYHELCRWIWNRDKKQSNIQCILDNIATVFGPFRESDLQAIKRKLCSSFLSTYQRQWKKCKRTKNRFMQQYKEWLEHTFIFDSTKFQPKGKHQSVRGRPRVSIENASERTKRRLAQKMRSTASQEEIANSLLSSTRKQLIQREHGFNSETIRNKALALYIDIGLSKDKYITLRKYNKETNQNNKYFPRYQEIMKAKKDCYPEGIQVTENGAMAPLQNLVDHTSNRLILSMDSEQLLKCRNKDIILKNKWGMDGSSGQQNFKQNFSERATFSSSSSLADSSVFIISFVPIEMICATTGEILWKNTRPSSTRYCRPIKFSFQKESVQLTTDEYQFYSNEIKCLNPTSVAVQGIKCTITHKFQCTMIDGKTCNVLTGQKSSASCNICKISPKNINNLNLIKSLPCDENAFQFGLSTLHCWIRFMECILHISYNIDFKKTYARDNHKIIKNEKKKQVQQALKERLGILVDVVRQSFGTTNDGNTSRTFFSNSEMVADITGVNEELIRRFSIILQVIACGDEINYNNFKQYSFETAELFITLYPWYNMPPSVHKVLIHGPDIIKAAMLPIGKLSEEALEAGNKIFKKVRAHNSRTCSRIANNEDIMHYLLICSDPFISNLRRPPKGKIRNLSPEAYMLLSIDEDSIDCDMDDETDEDNNK